MTNQQKRGQQKGCKCKQSKCMKLYCECLSMKIGCSELCSCIDCHNRDNYRQNLTVNRRKSKEQLIRGQKGCSCRRSNCTKKYCDCFQLGILCNELCKCVDCQNNESMTNLKVINQLRKNNSDVSNYQNNSNLYPLYLSQNSEHLNSIITGSNPLRLEENWLDNCARKLYEGVEKNNHILVFNKVLQILNELEQNISQQHSKLEQRQFSQQAHPIKRQQIGHQILNQFKPDDLEQEIYPLSNMEIQANEAEKVNSQKLQQRHKEYQQNQSEQKNIMKDSNIMDKK